ncbi:hypothetical protein PA598K_00714 [Paenibacillus sp. 598K]|uniref:hypothetical protein n=1 Tax=Paenibacillus sp. 598K TaxID=1117987 RepID=UPI000FFA6B45|nr:hypothetical protein [Paenibacillus sp. 598K]GBF72460.1 hypothetical protein PA598K_00714 [Paenibacillus sp. 598K]
MQTLDSYLSSLQDWCEETLLRGLDQLSLDELEALEQRAGQAEAWQLAYLAELLRQTTQTGRAARLGSSGVWSGNGVRSGNGVGSGSSERSAGEGKGKGKGIGEHGSREEARGVNVPEVASVPNALGVPDVSGVANVPRVPNVPGVPSVPNDNYAGESALADAFCMLSQYVLLAREQGDVPSDDSEPEEAGTTE